MTQRERYEKGGIGRWYWDHRDRAVLSFMGKGPVLDVGCGDGITTKKAGAIGMDMDQGNVRGSVYDLPFKAGTFGTVLLLEVIEHLFYPMWALSEIRRVLRPGGRIIILFPNDMIFKIAWFLCGMWDQIKKYQGHVWQCTPRKFHFFMHQTEFKVAESRSIPFKFWTVSLHHLVVVEKC